MKNIAIFASGNGSNFESLVKANLSCNIKVLICNIKDAYVIERAKKLGIEYKIVPSTDFSSNSEYEKELLKILERYNIDLIVLAGYMKIFTSEFITHYENAIINIHPSKLPNYRGLDAIKRAYDAGEEEMGVSIHYVDSGVDTGNLIACEVVKVDTGESLESVEEKVHKLEHILYPKVLEEIL